MTVNAQTMLELAAEAQLKILDHCAAGDAVSVTVTRVVFQNAAFTMRKLLEALQLPSEPTKEMALAGRKALAIVADRMEAAKLLATSSIDFWQRVGHEPANEIYKAMIDASPAAHTRPERCTPDKIDPYKAGKEWCPYCQHDDGAHEPSCLYALPESNTP